MNITLSSPIIKIITRMDVSLVKIALKEVWSLILSTQNVLTCPKSSSCQARDVLICQIMYWLPSLAVKDWPWYNTNSKKWCIHQWPSAND